MRRAGALCFVALVACGDGAAPSSSTGGQPADPRVTADATVGGDTDAAEDLDASVLYPIQPFPESGVPKPPPPQGVAFSNGPAGAAPIACDVDAASETQCNYAPGGCVDGGGTVYSGGWCMWGICYWQVQTISCTGSEIGGRCAPPGAPTTTGASFVDDAGTWVVYGGCAQPVPPAPAVTPVACSEAGACPLPASRCAGSGWLVYYDQGECDAGLCTWQERYSPCAAACRSGSCTDVIVTTPPM
jgi:hypothetical protein